MTELEDWRPRPAPELPPLEGAYVRTEPAHFPDDARKLFPALCGAGNDDLWPHIPIGPFAEPAAFGETMARVIAAQGWRTHLICARDTGEAFGMASYMRIRPEAGSAEIGCIVFSKALQKTRAATEAMYLMAAYLFDDLGYRRYEWKCDNANAASKRAAERYGFRPEGLFRQDMVMKGRNRDTAWFSIIDDEWPGVKAGFEAWLDPENFDPAGRQKRSLASLRS